MTCLKRVIINFNFDKNTVTHNSHVLYSHFSYYTETFDLSTNLSGDQSFVIPTTRVEPVRLTVGFDTPTTEPLSIFIYSIFQSVFTIDSAGDVKTNYLTA